MNSGETAERSDIFPLLLGLLAALTVFFILRPPILLFLRYSLGGVEDVSNVTRGRSAAVQVPVSADPANPIPVPPRPTSLTGPQAPSRWSDPLVASPAMSALADSIAALTNAERAARRLPELRSDPRLAEIAVRHSRDMIARDYLGHVSPDGDGPAQRVAAMHRTLFGTTRENVALYESEPAATDPLAHQFVTQWMNSLGHRRNVLSGDSTDIGVGCYEAPGPRPPMVLRKCTQIFAHAFAYAQDPIPEAVQVGSRLSLRLQPQLSAAVPVAVLQTDLSTDRPAAGSGSAAVLPQGTGVAGSLAVAGPAGLYGLTLQVPDPGVGGHYLLIPGPLVRVR